MVNVVIKDLTICFSAETISDDIFLGRKTAVRSNGDTNNRLYLQYLDIYLRIKSNAGDKSDAENRNSNNHRNLPYNSNGYWRGRNKYTHDTRAAFRKNH
jgi:hypothetical protein